MTDRPGTRTLATRGAGTLVLTYLALGVAHGTYIPFGTVVLSDRGIEPALIGLIIAAGAAFSALAAPVFGHLGDVVIGRRGVIVLAAGVSAVAYLVFGAIALPLVAATAIIVANTAGATLAPTLDAIAVVVARGAGRIGFAGMRALLSLAFGISAIAAGIAYRSTGYGAAPFVVAVLLAGLTLVAFLLPETPREPAAVAGARRRGGSAAEAFSVQPRLPLALLTFGLGIVALYAVFTYLPLRIAELGGGSTDVALAAGLEAFAEVPGFVVAGWLASRVGIRALFSASALLMAACAAIIALLADPALMVGMRLFTGAAYAGITVATVLALGALLPASLQATGQGLWLVTVSVVAVLLGVAGGPLYQVAGAPALFLLTGSLTALAALLGLRVLPGRHPR